MKIKIYIVTYDNDEILNKNLSFLYQSDLQKFNFQIFIINNYGILNDFENYENLYVLNNTLRPDFSNGHLSRNWNQALINGFKDLNNPDADLVILMQNDTYVLNNCFSNLVDLVSKYDFIQLGAGDQLMCFTPEAVRKIGIFDERFCSIAFQEADYFLTAFILHRDKISINDTVHKRLYNQITDVHKNYIQKVYSENKKHHVSKWHTYNYQLFINKWGQEPESWQQNLLNNLEKSINPLIKRYFFYPYFEKDITTLKEQNYEYFYIT